MLRYLYPWLRSRGSTPEMALGRFEWDVRNECTAFAVELGLAEHVAGLTPALDRVTAAVLASAQKNLVGH
jgi:hypothetical protein